MGNHQLPRRADRSAVVVLERIEPDVSVCFHHAFDPADVRGVCTDDVLDISAMSPGLPDDCTARNGGSQVRENVADLLLGVGTLPMQLPPYQLVK